MLVLLVILGLLAAVAGIIFSAVYYMSGHDAATYSYKRYDNPHSGFASWLYDLGYDNVEARNNRRKTNAEANQKRQEARG